MGRTQQIGITLGDPAGIGPEVVAHALARTDGETRRRLTLFGDRAILARGAEFARVTLPDDFEMVDLGQVDPEGIQPGQPSARAGAAQVAYLEAATAAAARGDIAGMVTAPVSKTTARAAQFGFQGHTDFLAERLGADRVAMMFVGPSLKVVLATTHIGLMTVGATLTVDRIVNATLLAVESLRRDFAIAEPRIGVLGLNPHAGEGGLFGSEEASVIEPAIETCRRRLGAGAITGPLVPDAAFRQEVDLFVAMYHDQALIPAKLLDFENLVNLTLGLPIVRTSPDHGVAYDIAGTGQARPTSFLAALDLCTRLIETRSTAPPTR
jgi:4-hydroxythreonine-4-phosphate dehydrogenase